MEDIIQSIGNFFGAASKTHNGSAVHGANATLVSDTTAQTVLADPGDGKAYAITQLIISNETPAESPVITVASGSAVHAVVAPGSPDVDGGGTKIVNFMPPIETTPSEALTAVAATAVGNVTVVANGFLVDA